MITCYIQYIIDPNKIKEFEHYAKLWIPLVNKFGGKHHGYFLPSEGKNNVALALFSFESLADYEQYRINSFNPNFVLEGASDVSVLGSRGVEEKCKRTRRVR